MSAGPLGGEGSGLVIGSQSPDAPSEFTALEEIQRRVLWLATNMIHHANKVRPNSSGIKVGGHQASSASVVTIMTALFFDFMRAGDKLSVKPHASPVLHAIHYLLGNLDREYLTQLRAFHGLQAYPSRTKDPDPVDFSTGSVGLGSVAPNFAALVDRFQQARFGRPTGQHSRFISLLGDAELDEGSIWEAVAEPALAGLDNLIWIIDVNRQSLDRIVPGIRVTQLEDMFTANGWSVIEAKYGRRLRQAFNSARGEGLRQAIDRMSNEQYQLLLRSPGERVADVLGEATPDVPEIELPGLIADLGGHDFGAIREALAIADAAPGPAVVFAYTIKGWGLPFAGDPLNHSALLADSDMIHLRQKLGIPELNEWPALQWDSEGGRLAAERRELLKVSPRHTSTPIELPDELAARYTGNLSTQQVFGQLMTGLARVNSESVSRIVTVSPDVATSTNLAGWINKVGVWEETPKDDPFSEQGTRLIRWKRHPAGQHIELGISETNLLMLLGQLGLAEEMFGQPLLPIGTLYDPFIARALDAYIYSVYSGGRFVLVGTPSGVTLAPEGGAHQSVLTPNVGLSIPQVTYWEPCFARELEWILIEALRALHRDSNPSSSYLRLSTLPIDQALFPDGQDRGDLRQSVLSGVYKIRDMAREPGARPGNRVDIWATGVMVPIALRASEDLSADGVYANVYNCVSPGLVFRSWQGSVHRAMEHLSPVPGGEGAPVVTVIDGHPSALAWIGSMLGVRTYPLGVSDFGQSGLPNELHAHFAIDSDSICYASYVALGGKV
jgi:pyruvate dehydrogenase E1 component